MKENIVAINSFRNIMANERVIILTMGLRMRIFHEINLSSLQVGAASVILLTQFLTSQTNKLER